MAVTGSTVTSTDGASIAYDVIGEGRTVVWLHGLSEDRFSWSVVTDDLTADFRCVRVDLRGHGESTHRPPYNFVALVSDLDAVVSATCDEPPIVVGHSLGGLVATVAAAAVMTGPVVCIDQPLMMTGLDLVSSLAPRLRDPATFADALMEEKLALGMDRVPEPVYRELERKARGV